MQTNSHTACQDILLCGRIGRCQAEVHGSRQGKKVARFVAFVSSGMIDTVTHTTTITAADFVDDQGNPVAPDDLPVPPIGGYYNVYVNGVLQEGGLTQLTNSQLVLSTDQISLDVPVMVEVHDYSGTTSSSVSTASVDVQTDIIT